VPCPVCRRVMRIPRGGSDELPHNFLVRNLIDSIEQLGKLSCESCEKDSEETQGNIAPATMYCVDCNQKLCKPCSRPHKAMKGRPHQVRELGDESTMKIIEQREICRLRDEGKQHDFNALFAKITPASSDLQSMSLRP